MGDPRSVFEVDLKLTDSTLSHGFYKLGCSESKLSLKNSRNFSIFLF